MCVCVRASWREKEKIKTRKEERTQRGKKSGSDEDSFFFLCVCRRHRVFYERRFRGYFLSLDQWRDSLEKISNRIYQDLRDWLNIRFLLSLRTSSWWRNPIWRQKSCWRWSNVAIWRETCHLKNYSVRSTSPTFQFRPKIIISCRKKLFSCLLISIGCRRIRCCHIYWSIRDEYRSEQEEFIFVFIINDNK